VETELKAYLENRQIEAKVPDTYRELKKEFAGNSRRSVAADGKVMSSETPNLPRAVTPTSPGKAENNRPAGGC